MNRFVPLWKTICNLTSIGSIKISERVGEVEALEHSLIPKNKEDSD